MKRTLLIMALATMMFVGCSDKADLTPAQIEFFEAMGEKISYMKPDTVVVLATTTSFEIKNFDIMESVYQGMRGDITIIDNVDPARIESFIAQIVTLKAQQDILLAEAKNEGLSISKDSIDAFMEKNLFAPNGGKDAFVEQLKLQQVDLDFVREDTRKNMLIMKYIDEVALAGVDVNVSEKAVVDYFNSNKEQYSQETATVRHILFLTQGKSEEEIDSIKTLAEEVTKRAKKGENFVSLVATYSEDPGSNTSGGLYADFPRGRMVQSFEDASFTLPVGTISDLVETPYGYHIIKIEDHKAGKTLDDVRTEVITALKEQKKEAAFPPILDSLVAKYEFKFTL
ncbi:MAG: peptidylprolyl isomerase [Candidatus Marinimicrobia bacterium]|nr:peptidylprolyl isomerase [Candidatus Neomarinimicrobiota bacterium]